MPFLPTTKQEMIDRGWTQPDFIYVTGDAYVDHPSFGHAIISRVLEKHGYKVAILAQPDWKSDKDITSLGAPRLGFLVSGGNMDSMVNHYTVNKKRRSTDAYTPGGKTGKRPDYACVVYGNLIRQYFGKDVPVIMGGIEPSLRRLAHYDYWSDRVKHSLLIDSQADLISYGMGEKCIVEIANALNDGYSVKDITFIRGTVYKCKDLSHIEKFERLPSFMEISSNKKSYATSYGIQYKNTDPFSGSVLVEEYEKDTYVVQNPPQFPLSQKEMDEIYALPYMRTYHPRYEKEGGVPAIEEIKFSVVSSRGCFGACSFCALTFHQGRIIQARSHESLINEVKMLVKEKDFKGYIHDVGGPTANFRHPACKKQLTNGACKERQCLFPKPCPNLDASHDDYIALLKKLRSIAGVKKVFVRSGIRFDYLLHEKKETFLRELCAHHVSGQLKIAPEHISDRVLKAMGKPPVAVYEEFIEKYAKVNAELGLKQYTVPYLMSSHPSSNLDDAIKLALFLKKNRLSVEQVQDFYPTPSTVSTCMYYTGIDPRNGESVYVASDLEEKRMQRALIQYSLPENYELVKKALIKAKREDLIGSSPDCLIRAQANLGRIHDKISEKKTNNNYSRFNKNCGNRQQGVNKGKYKRFGK
ncbi:MAG: YgiQ family radical SAM protein [Clostridiales bacterium]|nr:YgiQ family radical SAM protein [Clostridiales bacterium]